MISPEKLRSLLEYDPASGRLFWKHRKGNASFNKKFAGKEALNYKTRCGYLRGTVLGQQVLAHIAAFAISTRSWPEGQIDHRNGVRDDNRFTNLRITTVRGNAKNRKARWKTSGLPAGVTQDKEKFRSRITIDGRIKNIGSFNCPTKAHLSYLDAAAKHGFSARHGSPK